MTQNKKSFEIMDGPSKFDLFLALFDGRSVVFQIEYMSGKYPMKASIIGVVSAAGDNEHWIISGILDPSLIIIGDKDHAFTATYNTHHRNNNGVYGEVRLESRWDLSL